MQKYDKRSFAFAFPLNHKVVRNCKIITEHIGDLLIEGFAYKLNGTVFDEIDERYSVDIDFIRWNGEDIQPVLQLTNLHDDIEEAALQHASGLTYDRITYNDMLDIFADNLND